MDGNVDFNEYLLQHEQDPKFKKEYEKDKARLAAAVAVFSNRQKKGWSQRQLANEAHVPQSTIARIELGQNARLETIGKLATAMGMEVKISFNKK